MLRRGDYTTTAFHRTKSLGVEPFPRRPSGLRTCNGPEHAKQHARGCGVPLQQCICVPPAVASSEQTPLESFICLFADGSRSGTWCLDLGLASRGAAEEVILTQTRCTPLEQRPTPNRLWQRLDSRSGAECSRCHQRRRRSHPIQVRRCLHSRSSKMNSNRSEARMATLIC